MRSSLRAKALEASGIRFEEGEVVTVLLKNKAGALAEIAEKLADANVNLLALYVTGLEGDPGGARHRARRSKESQTDSRLIGVEGWNPRF